MTQGWAVVTLRGETAGTGFRLGLVGLDLGMRPMTASRVSYASAYH